MLKFVSLPVLVCAALRIATAAEITIQPERHFPSNLFDTGAPVELSFTLGKLPASADVHASGEIVDYDGKVVWRGDLTPVPSPKPGKAQVGLRVDPLPPGYYELSVKVSSGESTGADKTSFAVFPLVDRTAKQARDAGLRIGLKKWTYGKMSWKGGIDWDEHEATVATTRLGLQWTRDQFNWSSHQSVLKLINDYPMNVVLKIERFPKELFDAGRYGPLEDWTRQRKPAWSIYTVPLKEPYQAWLREELLKIPAEQNVFEIWNEPFNGMSAEDFAVICGYITEVLKDVRPDAIVGPNLSGSAGEFGFDAKFIAAGGMKGMNMVALHPYRNPPEGVRETIREYREWLTGKIGRDVIVTVTEYGSPTHPKGGVSEQKQARYTARQTILMYAEDVKIMTPHWMGQTERDPTYREDWYGFYRANQQPKPAVIALATVARMIDGGRYLGDLWFGPHIGASLFERDGIRTLALWSNQGERTISLDPDAATLRLVDIVGREESLAATGDRLELKLDEDVRYLVGVGPKLAARATNELNPERWPRPPVDRARRVAHRFAKPPVIDGKLDEWVGATRIDLLNEKINGADGSANVFIGWDETYLYLAVDVRDNEVVNKNPGGTNTIYRGDSIELFVSGTAKDNGVKEVAPDDSQFMISPASLDGTPQVLRVTDVFGGAVSPVEGLKASIRATTQGWVAELAIPISGIPGFVAKPGAKAALDLVLNDTDSTRSGRFIIRATDRTGTPNVKNPSDWALLVLEE